MPEHPTARRQETSVTTDSDADGVVDFDEMERFHTSPTNPDSDGDKVHDKQDIASGIFEPTYGYAFDPQPEGPGRDFDSDGGPDRAGPRLRLRGLHGRGGGQQRRRPPDPQGDVDLRPERRCLPRPGGDDHLGAARHQRRGIVPRGQRRPGDPSVRFDKRDGGWVDAGSSYTWTGSSKADDSPGDDPEHGYCSSFHETTTSTGGEPFAGSLASSIDVAVDRETKQVFVTGWVAGLLQGHKERGTPESNGGDTVTCVLKPSDYTQGGGSTLESQAEWGQVPRCRDSEESVDGAISDDGKTVAFNCTNTVTSSPQGNLTVVETMTVSGQPAFTARAP